MKQYVIFFVFSLTGAIMLAAEDPYYSFMRDAPIFTNNNKYFSATLSLDKKSGDLAFSVSGKRDEQVELNVGHNFKDDSISCKIKAVTVLGPNDLRERYKDISEDTVMDNDVLPPRPYHFMPRSPRAENPFPVKQNGTIQLKKGDMYSKSIKIWEMVIWETLVKESEENKDLTYRLSILCTLKVGDQFYSARPVYEIDYRTIRAMKNLKATFENQEKNKPPEDEEAEPFRVPIQFYDGDPREGGKLIETL